MATARGRFGGEPFGKKRFPLVFLWIPQTIRKLQGKKKNPHPCGSHTR